MKNSTIFKRGQIWYWEDPVFGPKTNNENLPVGEAAFRYNRYVLIVQADDTINSSSSLIVIPCSSVNHTPNDIQIPMAHIWHNGYTYAKCRSIFTVHPKMLTKYICTLPEDIMTLINAEIIKLMCPFIRDVLSDDDIKDWMHIDMNVEREPEKAVDDRMMIEFIRGFSSECIIATGDIHDRVTIIELKNAFDSYCISKSYPIEPDTLRFLDSFQHCIGSSLVGLSSWRTLDTTVVNNTEFRCIRLNPNLKGSIDVFKTPSNSDGIVKPSTTVAAPQKIEKPAKVKTSKWNDQSRAEFIKDYKELGEEACAKKYNISVLTARKYSKSFLNMIPVTKFNPVNIERIRRDPTGTDLPKSVSKIANMARDYLITQEAYTMGKLEMDKETFYKKLGSICYYSLMEYLEIRINGNKYYMPKVPTEGEQKINWKFFDICYHDPRISRITNLGELCEKIDELYDPSNEWYGKIRIGNAWLNNVANRLFRMGLKDKHINRILDAIRFATR